MGVSLVNLLRRPIVICIQFTVGVLVGALAGAVLLFYAGWEAYWYNRVGYACIKWHTHLMLYAYVWVLGAGVLYVAASPARRANYLLSFSAVTGTLFLLELFLLCSGGTKTYMEQRNGVYQSVFNYSASGKVYAYPAYSVHRLQAQEFNFVRHSNSDGFSDTDFASDTGRLIIQTYGDSFTEGDGAPADSSYPALLEHLLGGRFAVQNLGICGNDPGYYQPQFDSVGLRYHPTVAVFCYSTGDFTTDFLARGGTQRFSKKTFRQPPWWEPLYAVSYVSRLFFHALGYEHGYFFMSDAQIQAELQALQPEWNRVMLALLQQARAHGVQVLLIKKPERAEIEQNRYEYDFSFFENMADTLPGIHRADLLPYYRQQLPPGNVQEAVHQWYWRYDGHHNPTGYSVMARAVHNTLRKKMPQLLLP